MDNAYILGSNFGRDPDIQNDDRQRYTALTSDEKLTFWRGYFDMHGTIRKDFEERQYICRFSIFDPFLQPEFEKVFDIPFTKTNETVQINGINCVEFLYKLYDHVPFLSNFNAHTFHNILYGWKPSGSVGTPRCKFMKTLDDACPPTKAHVSDSGYDLQLVQHVKTENDVEFYDTGIAVQPPVGCYFELVARSSLAKTGYVLANSVGVIDASYTGSIKVALIKVCKDAPNIKLPARLVQLIPRQFIHLPMQEVITFDKTSRNEGGFGSTGSS
jgi:dUTP pyrophosphatase